MTCTAAWTSSIGWVRFVALTTTVSNVVVASSAGSATAAPEKAAIKTTIVGVTVLNGRDGTARIERTCIDDSIHTVCAKMRRRKCSLCAMNADNRGDQMEVVSGGARGSAKRRDGSDGTYCAVGANGTIYGLPVNGDTVAGE